MSDRYILNKDGEPEECEDLMEWAQRFETMDRKIALTEKGCVRVSTVFLGLDHSFGAGPPVLFETMIFKGEHDQWQDRYCTRKEALKGHKKACLLAFGEEK